MYNSSMKDIEFVKNTLKDNNIAFSDYAKAIGTTRQNVQNWTYGDGIPKKYLLKTAKYLSEISCRDISVENLLSIPNDTKSTSEKTTTSKKEKVA